MWDWLGGKKKPMPEIILNDVRKPEPVQPVGEPENYWLALAGRQARDGEFEVALETLKTAEEFGVEAGAVVARRVEVLESQMAVLAAKSVEIKTTGEHKNLTSQGNQTSADTEIEKGNQRYFAGDFVGAIESYEKAIEIKPDHHIAWGNRGLGLSNLGRNEEAIASYDRASQINPNYYDVWFNRGNILYNLGRKEEALASYNRAIEIKPDKNEAWLGRGNSLVDDLEALASYDRAIEIKSDYYEAWDGRGTRLSKLGRNDEAIASYKKAIEISPSYYMA
jgi:tetratricopeptide (TPR) repeat protein